jgi:hypothetical protein
MKRLTIAILLLLLAGPCLAEEPITLARMSTAIVGGGVTAAAAPEKTVIADDFGSNTISNYTAGSGTWNVTGGLLLGPTLGTDTLSTLRYTAASCTTVSQYVAIKNTDVSKNLHGVVFRATGATGYRYAVRGHSNGNTYWQIYDAESWVSNPANCALAWADNDVMAVTVTGTGTDTVISLWKNPTSETPTNSTTWGTNAANCTFTANPSNAADTGLVVGIFAIGVENNTQAAFDNFRAGDIP